LRSGGNKGSGINKRNQQRFRFAVWKSQIEAEEQKQDTRNIGVLQSVENFHQVAEKANIRVSA
jgi:hypothetical protein